MGDHYLSQPHPKDFSFNDRLWAHDLELRKGRPSKPKSEASVNGLEPNELRRHLAGQIEGPVQDQVDRIWQRQSVGHSEREILATYLLSMWKRVPVGKEWLENSLPMVARGTSLTNATQSWESHHLHDPPPRRLRDGARHVRPPKPDSSQKRASCRSAGAAIFSIFQSHRMDVPAVSLDKHVAIAMSQILLRRNWSTKPDDH